MIVLTSQLPSGGYGYLFPSVNVEPFDFLNLTRYLENVPKDPLEKYLFDIKVLCKDDPRIMDCYVMDVDFLIFFKKLCTVSEDLTYNISVKCPDCGETVKKRISLEHGIHFKQIDDAVMNGAVIELSNGHKYDTIVPTTRDFIKVFERYLRYRKVEDLDMIKTIALIKQVDLEGNQVEADILGAKGKDITMLLALRELYYERLEPVNLYCPRCNENLKPEERRSISVSVESLIGDFFRDLLINSPIDGSKILFK